MKIVIRMKILLIFALLVLNTLQFSSYQPRKLPAFPTITGVSEQPELVSDSSDFVNDSNLLDDDKGAVVDHKNPKTTKNKITGTEDQAFIEPAMSYISEEGTNIEDFIENLDRIDCSKYNGNKKDPQNVLCDGHLVETAFSPLGQTNSDHNDFFEYLQQAVYKPLAYGVAPRANLSDMILDSMNLDPKDSLFHGQSISTDYNKFEESILGLFERMADKSSDIEENKDDVSELIMNTLKRFHLYWNYLRYQNKFDKLKIDTKEILY